MSAIMNNILIIGGTSGIGEAFARRFHSMGKRVIITGRRDHRLANVKKSLSGLETYNLDPSDFQSLPSHVANLFSLYPNIDTVWVNAGTQYASSIKDFSSTTDAEIADEINVNVTAPMILGHHVIPRLLQQNFETAFMITGSGIGFVPAGALFPVYGATKSAVHAYCVGIRQALKGTNVNVVEIVPPYVGGTELGSGFSQEVVGKLKNFTPLPMDDFVREVFTIFDSSEGKDLKEVAGGSAVPRVNAWRSSIGEILVKGGMGG